MRCRQPVVFESFERSAARSTVAGACDAVLVAGLLLLECASLDVRAVRALCGMLVISILRRKLCQWSAKAEVHVRAMERVLGRHVLAAFVASVRCMEVHVRTGRTYACEAKAELHWGRRYWQQAAHRKNNCTTVQPYNRTPVQV